VSCSLLHLRRSTTTRVRPPRLRGRARPLVPRVRRPRGAHRHAALLAAEQLQPENTVFVSGIGCSSRFPHYLKTYGFHGIHGRALPVATGIKLHRPELDVFVVMGDGDCCSIGAAHWLHATRYNMDMTALMLDNNIYGLTKNQTSPTTPQGTPATRSRTELAAGAEPHRGDAGHHQRLLRGADGGVDPGHLYATLLAAYRHRGFAFVRILQRCPCSRPGSRWTRRAARTSSGRSRRSNRSRRGRTTCSWPGCRRGATSPRPSPGCSPRRGVRSAPPARRNWRARGASGPTTTRGGSITSRRPLWSRREREIAPPLVLRGGRLRPPGGGPRRLPRRIPEARAPGRRRGAGGGARAVRDPGRARPADGRPGAAGAVGPGRRTGRARLRRPDRRGEPPPARLGGPAHRRRRRPAPRRQLRRLRLPRLPRLRGGRGEGRDAAGRLHGDGRRDAREVAAYLGVDAGEADRRVARLLCAGGATWRRAAATAASELRGGGGGGGRRQGLRLGVPGARRLRGGLRLRRDRDERRTGSRWWTRRSAPPATTAWTPAPSASSR
jgi:hypothetical protein